MTIREKMQSGELYLPSDETILKEQYARLEILYDFNATRPSELEKREEILRRLFAEIGEDCYIEPPLHANWGSHTHFGNHVYANFKEEPSGRTRRRRIGFLNEKFKNEVSACSKGSHSTRFGRCYRSFSSDHLSY